MPTNYKIALAALAGFSIAAWLFHTPTSKAQYSGYIHVQQAPFGQGLPVRGEVVGFSCVQVQGQEECYVATR